MYAEDDEPTGTVFLEFTNNEEVRKYIEMSEGDPTYVGSPALFYLVRGSSRIRISLFDLRKGDLFATTNAPDLSHVYEATDDPYLNDHGIWTTMCQQLVKL